MLGKISTRTSNPDPDTGRSVPSSADAAAHSSRNSPGCSGLQRQQQRKATDALEALHALTPSWARVVGDDGRVRTVSVDALCVGSLVEVGPGESVPVDGDVVVGASELNEALLTGEASPVPVEPGRRVFAGSVNLTAPIRVSALAAGQETRAGRIMRLVEESEANRAPIVRLADRISGAFVAVVLALAATTAALWWRIDPARAVDHAAALLIVTCPCALGMATPLSVIAALGRAARRGILIKGGEMLEALSSPGVLLLDKTGTITEGRMAVRRWEGPASLRPLVGALEAGCAHPIARAFACGGGAAHDVSAVRHAVGGGIEGVVDGRALRVGSRAFIESSGDVAPGWASAFERACAEEGQTSVLVSEGGVVVAAAGLGDPIRADARATIATLRARGWDVGILSGDDGAVVRRVAEAVGVDVSACHARLSPEDKLAIVREEVAARARGPVVMVGDGVNDAAALAAATVGVAVSGGTEASLHAAGVYLSGDGLAPLAELLDGARRTMGVIRLALGASLFYNAIVVALAMSGALSPLMAAVLMPASSVTVISIAFRGRTFAASAQDGRRKGGGAWK
ncbi:MAG: cation-translocating P-type ATPase [Phycisphaerales bacterium]|nr:cation-translocating P-type ATPase [Phycisphaerales bacterium]